MSRIKNSFKEKTVAASKQPQSEPKSTSKDPLQETSQEERIRQRAYELYRERGGTDGSHEEDWQRAEEEIRGKRDAPDKVA